MNENQMPEKIYIPPDEMEIAIQYDKGDAYTDVRVSFEKLDDRDDIEYVKAPLGYVKALDIVEGFIIIDYPLVGEVKIKVDPYLTFLKTKSSMAAK